MMLQKMQMDFVSSMLCEVMRFVEIGCVVACGGSFRAMRFILLSKPIKSRPSRRIKSYSLLYVNIYHM